MTARPPAASPLPPEWRPARAVVRRSAGTWTLQSTLHRHGLGPVAGVDEAGRGACAGPLVVAACVLRPGDAKRLDGLTDSKLLTPAAREEYYDADPAPVRGQRASSSSRPTRSTGAACTSRTSRACAGRSRRWPTPPGYVLTDGFAVRGFGRPALAVPKGDQAAACVAAASVLAKVTRDRIMVDLHAELPQYGFDAHKGYCTPVHDAALAAHGPSPVHRYSFVNVARRLSGGSPALVHNDAGRRGRADDAPESGRSATVSAEDLEKYETEMELTLYKEYRDIVSQFSYVVETERRFYLANSVDVAARNADGEIYFEVRMSDAWVWDMYRPGAVREERPGAHVQGRQRRGARQARPAAARRRHRSAPEHSFRTDVLGS